jgi:ribosomal protein S18 acetylase RimI-like enzyme
MNVEVYRYAGLMSAPVRDWMMLRLNAPVDSPHEPLGTRAPRASDVEGFANLMWNAYRGTVDDGGESLEDARGEASKTFDGGYGAIDWEASCVVERGGELAAATIVVRDATKWATGEAFIAFSMTSPKWKRQGLARAGMVRALACLSRRGEPRVHLVVTRENRPAVALYESLGFERIDLKQCVPWKGTT